MDVIFSLDFEEIIKLCEHPESIKRKYDPVIFLQTALHRPYIVRNSERQDRHEIRENAKRFWYFRLE